MNVVAYCRVSTDTTDQLNSLEAQKNFFDDYAKKNDYNLIKIYADEGISGTKIKNRTEFLNLMKDAQQGIFDTVIVKDISRFARNTVDFLNGIRMLKSLNIETIFLTSNQTVLGNSEFILTIFGALAQEESANTSKRVKFGKKINAEKGRVPNMVYGYNKTKGDYFNLEINVEESDIVKQIFNMYVNDGVGANKISMLLNAEGYKTKRNYKWSQNAISRILTNHIYTGKIINGKQEIEDFLTGVRTVKDERDWIIIENPDFKIIDQEIFDKAQSILTSRCDSFNVQHERLSNKHLFSTLLKCDCCGYSFRRFERIYKNTYIRWVCSGRNSFGTESCDNKTVLDEEKIWRTVQNDLTELLQNKEIITKNIIKEFNQNLKKDINSEKSERELIAKLNKVNNSKKKYMEMYEDDLITREELKTKVSEINMEIDKANSELKIFQYHLNKGNNVEDLISKSFDNINMILSQEYITNAMLKEVINKIVVNSDGTFDTHFKLFDIL